MPFFKWAVSKQLPYASSISALLFFQKEHSLIPQPIFKNPPGALECKTPAFPFLPRLKSIHLIAALTG